MNKYWVGLFSLLLLMGCELSKHKMAEGGREIDDLLQSASAQNHLVATRGQPHVLSAAVKKALSPNVSLKKGSDISRTEKRYDIVADQVPARSFFLGLVEDTPYNVAINPDVSGKISIQLKKVTIPEVLETIRNTYGFDYRYTRQGIEILPASIQTRAFSVNYLDVKRSGTASTQVSAGTLSNSSSSGGGTSAGTGTTSAATPAGTTSTAYAGGAGVPGQSTTNSTIESDFQSDFWKELQKAVETIIGTGEGRKVAISPISSLIIVSAMPDELKHVEDFLRDADLSLNRQVILEAKVLEVELNDSYQAGINWSELSGRFTFTQFGGDVIKNAPALSDAYPVLSNELTGNPINFTPGGASPVTALANSFGGVFAATLNARNLGAFIELLGAQGKVHVLSNPRVSTINNQKALLKVGFDRFFITNVSTTSTISSSTTQSTPNVTFSPFFTGVALDVTPHITAKDEITLHIHPTISEVKDDLKNFTLNGQEQSYPLAKTTVRESDSMVKARNTETVIIGGLMQDFTSQSKEGIPLLKDLPVIGHLFRHEVQQTKKSELVILLRPTIVGDRTWSMKLDEVTDRFQGLERGSAIDDSRFRCREDNGC